MNRRIFHYYPTDIKNSYTGKSVKGFKYLSTDASANTETSANTNIFWSS